MALNDGRISWPTYFMSIATLVAERSTCLRRKVGAVAIRNSRILATGYNGAPSGIPHCLNVGCIREVKGIPSGQQLDICRAVHAEQNLIIQAALHGISLHRSDVYCTCKPCFTCAKMLINVGVKSIIISQAYPDDNTDKLLEDAGVRLVYI